MQQRFDILADFLDHDFDCVIDARSPAEYAEDHIPGAINLPSLSNSERAEVGTIYKQVSPFDARKLGAALVARNVADHVRGPLADHPGDWKPLVYCWRGGQRSGSFATILSQIGWRTGVVAGGYMAWRRLVVDALYQAPFRAPVILLDGLTGTAKTDILHDLAGLGAQVLDLEGMAHHRGSLLGARAEGQPSQKAFESQLAVALATLDPNRPVIVEAESNKIGDLHIPPALWDAMKTAPAILIEAPVEARARYLTQAYRDMVQDPDTLRDRMTGLRELRGGAVVDGWSAMLDQGDFTELATALMVQHYDPAYRKSRAAHDRQIVATLHASDLAAPDRADLAQKIACIVSET